MKIEITVSQMPTSSPWGRVQGGQLYGPIWSVSTASHGGMLVPEELMPFIPEAHREYARVWSGSAQWFEEDCAACCVIVAFPEWFPAEWQESAKRTVAHYIDGETAQ